MVQVAKNTAMVTSTDLKLKYKSVVKLLEKDMIVLVSNRNSKSKSKVDGIFIPYSEVAIEKVEDLLEDIKLELNREKLDKEFKESYLSENKKKYSLDEL